MKKALCLAALLGLAAVAYAESGIDIYLTRGSDWQVFSGDNAWMRFYGGLMHFTPYAAWPAVQPPHSLLQQQCGTTETYYVWADVTLDPGGAPNVARLSLRGLDLRGSYVWGDANIGQNVMYRQRLGAGLGRWDGAVPIPFPGQAVAVTALGVDFQKAGDAAPVLLDGLGWVEGLTAHVLLGAFEFTCGRPPSPAEERPTPCDGKFYLKTGVNFVLVVEWYWKTTPPPAEFVVIGDYLDPFVPGGWYPRLTFQGQPWPYPPPDDAILAIECVAGHPASPADASTRRSSRPEPLAPACPVRGP